MNEFSKANDPFENRKSFEKFLKSFDNKLTTDKDGLFDLIIQRNHEENELIRGFSKYVRFISFSKNTVNKMAYGLPAMWAHYGQNHKGVCFVFDRNLLCKLFKTQFGAGIKYTSLQYGELSYPNIQKNETDTSKDFFLKHSKKLFFKKDFDWKSESEFRYILIREENESDLIYLKNMNHALIAIILGIDFNENYKCSIERLRSNLPNKNIGVYQLRFENGEFKLDPENGYSLFDYMIVEN